MRFAKTKLCLLKDTLIRHIKIENTYSPASNMIKITEKSGNSHRECPRIAIVKSRAKLQATRIEAVTSRAFGEQAIARNSRAAKLISRKVSTRDHDRILHTNLHTN